VLRDLAPVVQVSDHEARGRIPVRPEICAPSGRVLAGPVATLVDMLAGGLAARAAHPNWMATADLTLHLVERPSDGEIEAVGRVVRAGRSTVVMEVELSAGGAPAGLASMTFAVLPRREGNPDIVRSANTTDDGVPPAWLSGGNLVQPIADALEVRVIDGPAGVLEAPVIDYSCNTLDALQGGVVATLLCLAADHVLPAACGAPVETVDLHLTYLALNKVSPVRTRAEVITATPSHGTARIETVDGDGRVTAVATAVATLPRASP